LVLLALLSCADECVELPADCTPQYTPTFDNVWANTLSTTCALSGCHATGQGGLTMGTTADEAYSALLDGYVVPGSVLAQEERCAVETWIAQGAER
jgi:hypothetical protein